MRVAIIVGEYAMDGQRGGYVQGIHALPYPVAPDDAFPDWTVIEVEVPQEIEAETIAALDRNVDVRTHALVTHYAPQVMAALRAYAS